MAIPPSVLFESRVTALQEQIHQLELQAAGRETPDELRIVLTQATDAQAELEALRIEAGEINEVAEEVLAAIAALPQTLGQLIRNLQGRVVVVRGDAEETRRQMRETIQPLIDQTRQTFNRLGEGASAETALDAVGPQLAEAHRLILDPRTTSEAAQVLSDALIQGEEKLRVDSFREQIDNARSLDDLCNIYEELLRSQAAQPMAYAEPRQALEETTYLLRQRIFGLAENRLEEASRLEPESAFNQTCEVWSCLQRLQAQFKQHIGEDLLLLERVFAQATYQIEVIIAAQAQRETEQQTALTQKAGQMSVKNKDQESLLQAVLSKDAAAIVQYFQGNPFAKSAIFTEVSKLDTKVRQGVMVLPLLQWTSHDLLVQAVKNYFASIASVPEQGETDEIPSHPSETAAEMRERFIQLQNPQTPDEVATEADRSAAASPMDAAALWERALRDFNRDLLAPPAASTEPAADVAAALEEVFERQATIVAPQEDIMAAERAQRIQATIEMENDAQGLIGLMQAIVTKDYEGVQMRLLALSETMRNSLGYQVAITTGQHRRETNRERLSAFGLNDLVNNLENTAPHLNAIARAHVVSLLSQIGLRAQQDNTAEVRTLLDRLGDQNRQALNRLYGLLYQEHVRAGLPERRRAHRDYGRVGFREEDGFIAPTDIKLRAVNALLAELDREWKNL